MLAHMLACVLNFQVMSNYAIASRTLYDEPFSKHASKVLTRGATPQEGDPQDATSGLLHNPYTMQQKGVSCLLSCFDLRLCDAGTRQGDEAR
jgi:hypothetical protein